MNQEHRADALNNVPSRVASSLLQNPWIAFALQSTPEREKDKVLFLEICSNSIQ
jgi:hypothetical protein